MSKSFINLQKNNVNEHFFLKEYIKENKSPTRVRTKYLKIYKLGNFISMRNKFKRNNNKTCADFLWVEDKDCRRMH